MAILDGQTGTISCSGSRPLHWCSRSPTDKGLGNGNADARPGYNISEFPSGIYHLQFTINLLSTPTIISCSEPGSGIEKSVHVIVFGRSSRIVNISEYLADYRKSIDEIFVNVKISDEEANCKCLAIGRPIYCP